jgi:hypothetical protein
LLTVAWGIALGIVGRAWYQLEGYKVVNPLFRDWFGPPRVQANDLLVLHLDIDPAEYRALARQRERAWRRGILQPTDDDWIDVQIRFQDTSTHARVRLNGDDVGHWQKDKWSFQVVSDKALLGMRIFAVQSPETYGYLNKWLYTESLRRAGILAPRSAFVNVIVNDDHWGIYALQERISQELFASQARPEGVLVQFDDCLLGRDRDLNAPTLDPTVAAFALPAFVLADEFGNTDLSGDPVLEEQSRIALGLLNRFQSQELAAFRVFDTDIMGRYLAHTSLWGSLHELAWYDIRYYYHPFKARLEPIGYYTPTLDPMQADLADLSQYDDLSIIKAYAQELARISQPIYLQDLQRAYDREFDRYSDGLAHEFPPAYLQAPWETLSGRQAMLHAALHPPQTVHAHQVSEGASSPDRAPSVVDIRVGNLLRYPVALRQLQNRNHTVDIQPDWVLEKDSVLLYQEATPPVVLRRVQETVPRYVTLRVPATAIQELFPQFQQGTPLSLATLQIVTNLVGVDEPVIVEVRGDDSPNLTVMQLPEQPSLESAREQHPFLTLADQPGFLTLQPGTWQVEGNLILPDGFGLWVTEPVTLAFDQQAYLLSTEPLILHSSDKKGIRFVPKGSDWGGILVFRAGSTGTSSLYNVEIRGTTGIRHDGWSTSGGTTFYSSPVTLNRCRVLGSTAPSAIHIARSDFAFTHSEFGHTSFDAFDGYSVQGRIEQCTFHDVLGNGIDVSHSNVALRNVRFLRVFDKGLVADTGSKVTAQGIRADEVGTAIISKDASYIDVRDMHVARARIAGIGAYLEKLNGGRSTVRASDVIFGEGVVQVLAQKRSSVTIDGIAAAGREVGAGSFARRLETEKAIRALNLHFGSVIRLIGYRLDMEEYTPGRTVQLVLYWQALAKPSQDYTVFVHVVDGSGHIVAQRDTMPGENAYPTTGWASDEVIEDVHLVPLPADMSAGEVQIVLGMYEWQGGARLPVSGRDGEALANAAVVLGQRIRVNK